MHIFHFSDSVQQCLGLEMRWLLMVVLVAVLVEGWLRWRCGRKCEAPAIISRGTRRCRSSFFKYSSWPRDRRFSGNENETKEHWTFGELIAIPSQHCPLWPSATSPFHQGVCRWNACLAPLAFCSMANDHHLLLQDVIWSASSMIIPSYCIQHRLLKSTYQTGNLSHGTSLLILAAPPAHFPNSSFHRIH